MVLTFVIFILSMVVLSLIFVPKLVIQYKYSKMTVQEQRSSLAVSVRESSGMKAGERRTSSGPTQPSRPLVFAEKENISSADFESKLQQSKEESETARGSSR
mmetsp:Transcript_17446/g.42406  ORF Transcript_17446/g.42406 Transcript_17446/m.42406 type:complete len:102 (-) Transcript_17446:75-380(-)